MNEIFCGESSEILSKFEANTIDLTITSPPYDFLRDYKQYTFDYKLIIDQLYRVTKDGGVVVWVVGDSVINGSESGSSFRQALYFMEAGFNLHDTMIYAKNSSSFPARRSGNRYTQIWEYMFVFSKGKPKTARLICDKPNRWVGWQNWGKKTLREKSGKLREIDDIKKIPEFSPRYNIWGKLEKNSDAEVPAKLIDNFNIDAENIWQYSTGKGYSSKDKEAFIHPAIFPEELAEDHILSWSNESDIVLDPMCGSGTTLKMAKKNNRNYIGIDISEEYCELSKLRLK